METNKLLWLRGPLPPISESILASGILNKSATLSTKKNPNNENNLNMKKVFQSGPAPTFKEPTKIQFKPKHVLSVKAKKSASLDSTLSPFYQSINADPQIPRNYKPPSLDETALKFKTKSTFIPQENLTQKILLPKQSNYREFIQDLVHELDSNISSIVPVSPEVISPETQAHVKLKLMEFYNYSFNQLILKERTISSDKALLLRRFMQFYNQILQDYPYIIENLENKNNQFIEDISNLKNQVEELNQKILFANDSAQKVEESNKAIKEQLEKTINDSNSKDLTISSIAYDNDISKSQLNKLQFRYNKLKEENENLSNSLKLRDEEIKGQLCQIEDVTKKLAEYQQGDTGYIVMYHEEKDKTAKLEKEIEFLKQKIYDLENIEKTSIAVDTTDLPVKKTKKKKMVKDSSISNNQQATSSANLNLSQNDDENSPSNVRKKANQTPKPKNQPISTTESSTQTELNNRTISLSIGNDPVTFCIGLIEITENAKSDKSKINLPSFEIENYLNKLKVPDGYDKKISELPSLHKFIMPLFSDVYIPASKTDLKMVNITSDQISTQNQKPLIWGLQLIHTFLTDPYVRSIENKTLLSNEDVFVNWILCKYKVQHLVNQVIIDFVGIISTFKHNETVSLFLDFLEGGYNFSQLCFLATVYSFGCYLTIPEVNLIYQTFDSESSENEEIMIHVKAAHALFKLCFSDDIADRFVQAIQNCEMVNFTSFLRKITDFFGEKHKLISNQARDLLSLVGCSDANVIIYDVFESVMIMLDCPPKSIKSEWKNALKKSEGREEQFITIKELLELSAEKDELLRKLLNVPNLKKALIKLKNMSQIVYELYHEFIRRFSKKLPYALSLLSDQIKKKVQKLVQKLKIAIFNIDVQGIIWFYKKLIAKIDHLKMKELGFIPFNYNADADAIMKLNEYINKAEEVSFAMLS